MKEGKTSPDHKKAFLVSGSRFCQLSAPKLCCGQVVLPRITEDGLEIRDLGQLGATSVSMYGGHMRRVSSVLAEAIDAP